jgi:IS30 family transposase
MYTQLTYEKLIQIQALLNITQSRAKIAHYVWCHKSTISRLLQPFKDNYQLFDAQQEWQRKQQARNDANQQFHKLSPWSDLSNLILEKIQLYWSPEQISGRCKMQRNINISTQTIYNHIHEHYPELIKQYFRRQWKKYKYGTIPAKHIPNRKWIELRPKVVETRQRIWDFEWDTICGKGHKQRIVTYVDRKTNYLLAWKLHNTIWLAWELTITSRELFASVPKEKKHTITDDNWVEFIDHEEFTKQTGIMVYFANKYRPWERWTNEYHNWLLRQFLPKWYDFDSVTDQELDRYVELINTRPRKKLWRKTPKEIFWW